MEIPLGTNVFLLGSDYLMLLNIYWVGEYYFTYFQRALNALMCLP